MTALQTPPAASTPPAIPAHSPNPALEDQPRRLSRLTVDGIGSLAGSLLSALALTWICYEKILALSGPVGFVVLWWAVTIACYAGVSLLSNPVPAVIDRLAGAVVVSGALVVGSLIVWVIVYTFVRGEPALVHPNFYVDDMDGVGPTSPLSQGGVRFAIVGSIEQVAIATAIALPLGVGTAVFLAEVGGGVARAVRTVVEAMTALPDILAGLFIYTVLIIGLGWSRNGLAVGLALSVTMTPIVARSAEVVLRVVPGGLREASLALGASQWQTVWRVVLPTARSGLATSLILGIARVAGESAPLIIVSAATTFWNSNPVNSEPQGSLPLFIYTQIRSPEPNSITRGWGAAALLLFLVLVLFVAARIAARDRLGGRAAAPRRAPGRPPAGAAPTPTTTSTITPTTVAPGSPDTATTGPVYPRHAEERP